MSHYISKPKWFTKKNFLKWLQERPENTRYFRGDAELCPLGKFCAANGLEWVAVGHSTTSFVGPLDVGGYKRRFDNPVWAQNFIKYFDGGLGDAYTITKNKSFVIQCLNRT